MAAALELVDPPGCRNSIWPGFHQLLLTVAADVELEVAAPLVWAIIQFARPAAQTVFAREDVRGIHV